MNDRSKSTESKLTDSPWFWAYLFATAALVALLIAGPRYLQRQGQLERQFSARQAAGQVVVGRDGPIPPNTDDHLIVSLSPLYAVAALILFVGSAGLWYFRFRPRDTDARDMHR